jgi:hypothetical protein
METAEWQGFVDAAFSRLDVDGDGFIELEELLERMPQDFLRGWAAPSMQRFLAAVFTAGCVCRVCLCMCASVCAQGCAPTGWVGHWRGAASLHTEGQRGTIAPAVTFGHASLAGRRGPRLHPLSPPPPPPPAASRSNAEERMIEAKRMLREADANGDGRISRAEFSALLLEKVSPDSLSLYDNRLKLGAISPAA